MSTEDLGGLLQCPCCDHPMGGKEYDGGESKELPGCDVTFACPLCGYTCQATEYPTLYEAWEVVENYLLLDRSRYALR